MSGKSKSSIKGTARKTRSPLTPENAFKFVFQSHYVTLYNSIAGSVVGKFNEGERVFTTEQFLSGTISAEARKAFTIPTPSNFKLAVIFICNVFEHYMHAIEIGDDEFCDTMLSLHDVHDMALRTAHDPLNHIAEKVVANIPKTKEVDDNIARNLNKFVKLLVEAYSICQFVGNRVPKAIPLETLCAISGMSGELLTIARSVKLPEPKKKGAAAAASSEATEDDEEETS